MSTLLSLLLAHCLAAVLSAAPGVQPGPRGVWPLQPRPEVVTGFDPPDERWGAGHRGVDLLGRPGQPVRAAKPGTVAYAGLVAGVGVVVVSHGDRRTTYQPVDASVAVGDRVVAGQRIGSLRPAGSHCRPRTCLHWGLLRGETYLDPLTLVGAGPVRLLPLFSDPPASPLSFEPPWVGPGPAGAPAARPPAPAWAPPPWRAPPVVPAWVRPGGAPAGRPVATGPW